MTEPTTTGPPGTGFLAGRLPPMGRRVVTAASYALLTVLLARSVAGQIPSAQEALEGFGQILPDAIQALGPGPATVALITLGIVAFFLAGGTFLVSRDTGSAFALLAVGTAGWFLFPYSEIPWASVLSGGQSQTLQAPASAWLYAGLITVLATAEVLFSARETLLASLTRRDLPEDMVDQARSRTRTSAIRTTVGAILLGGTVAVLYGTLRDDLSRGLLAEPDLLWVPAIAGLIAGIIIWLTSLRA